MLTNFFRREQVVSDSAVPAGRFSGIIGTVPNNDGYGFITLSTVTRENGQPHDIPTEDDIYIHQSNCAARLEHGKRVSFNLDFDRKRGEGHFSAVGATEVVEAEFLPSDGEPVPGFTKAVAVANPNQGGQLVLGAVARTLYHVGAKQISPDAIKQVAENDPLSGIPRGHNELTPDEQRMLLQAFLAEQYPALSAFGADFDVLAASDEDLDETVDQSNKEMELLGMTEQVPVLKEQVASFKKVRAALRMIFEDGLVRPDTIIKMRYLPDLFMAAPVWYFWVNPDESDQVAQAWKNNDPQPHASTRFFCSKFPNLPWVDTFQLFNRRVRTLKQYKGDSITPALSKRMLRAVELFDYVVIATPYHSQAGMDWQNLKWLQMIDPYILGFKKELDYFFVLGRFSDTGIFPLYHDMVADTLAFLEANKPKLDGFNQISNPYWVRDTGETGCFADSHPEYYSGGSQNTGDILKRHVDTLLKVAREDHRLFDWLRGEYDPNNPDTKVPATVN